MANPFLGEIRMAGFTIAPHGWAFCNGQLLPINQNQALFALLGTTYGGDGRTTFALPNLQARVPIHVGEGNNLGNLGGEITHTLTSGEMPTHTHPLNAYSGNADNSDPQSDLLATATGGINPYGSPGGTLTSMSTQAITSIGGSQPHDNMQPYLVINFIIALQGIFPSRN